MAMAQGEKFPEMRTPVDTALGSDFEMIETKLRKICRKHSKEPTVPTMALAPSPAETRSRHFLLQLKCQS